MTKSIALDQSAVQNTSSCKSDVCTRSRRRLPRMCLLHPQVWQLLLFFPRCVCTQRLREERRARVIEQNYFSTCSFTRPSGVALQQKKSRRGKDVTGIKKISLSQMLERSSSHKHLQAINWETAIAKMCYFPPKPPGEMYICNEWFVNSVWSIWGVLTMHKQHFHFSKPNSLSLGVKPPLVIHAFFKTSTLHMWGWGKGVEGLFPLDLCCWDISKD